MPENREYQLIEALASQLSKGDSASVYRSIGDDTAVVRPPRGKMLLTCDMLVEGVHFRLDFSTPFQLGWKALAVNLSDLAAMGGEPLYALISLGLAAEELDSEFYHQLYRGLNELAELSSLQVVGGDTVHTSGPLVIDLSLVGCCSNHRPVLRTGARPGQVLAVTGKLGASAAGLQWLLENHDQEASSVVEEAIDIHLQPSPRLEEGALAATCMEEGAMIDLSDGLAGDLGHICRESGVSALLEEDKIPLAQSTIEVAEALDRNPLEWALHGGEDYELLMAVEPKDIGKIKRGIEALGTPLTVIGEISKGEGEVILHRSGGSLQLQRGGYTHL